MEKKVRGGKLGSVGRCFFQITHILQPNQELYPEDVQAESTTKEVTIQETHIMTCGLVLKFILRRKIFILVLLCNRH